MALNAVEIPFFTVFTTVMIVVLIAVPDSGNHSLYGIH